jgi:hypothetical protein
MNKEILDERRLIKEEREGEKEIENREKMNNFFFFLTFVITNVPSPFRTTTTTLKEGNGKIVI